MNYYYVTLICVVLILPVMSGILSQVLETDVTISIYVGFVIIMLGIVLDNQRKVDKLLSIIKEMKETSNV